MKGLNLRGKEIMRIVIVISKVTIVMVFMVIILNDCIVKANNSTSSSSLYFASTPAPVPLLSIKAWWLYAKGLYPYFRHPRRVIRCIKIAESICLNKHRPYIINDSYKACFLKEFTQCFFFLNNNNIFELRYK